MKFDLDMPISKFKIHLSRWKADFGTIFQTYGDTPRHCHCSPSQQKLVLYTSHIQIFVMSWQAADSVQMSEGGPGRTTKAGLGTVDQIFFGIVSVNDVYYKHLVS